MPPPQGQFGFPHMPPQPYNPHMPPQHRGMMPQGQFIPQGIHNPMMVPQVQQQPISDQAKADVIERSELMISQATIARPKSKKKIVRVYDRPGFCMEEVRAQHMKYSVA